jgi:hypothetical protein
MDMSLTEFFSWIKRVSSGLSRNQLFQDTIPVEFPIKQTTYRIFGRRPKKSMASASGDGAG